MILYVVAAVVVVLLWAVVLVLGLPVWAALVPTVLAALGIGALVFLRKRAAHKAAKQIEQALSAQADAHAKNARPDMQPEIEAMQSEFSKAVGALKSSKLARGGRDALSVLPWYLIIGPPGSGKSTALRNSGLQFPYLSQRGGGVKGVGGTRNCEWWLTNEAVILDTAGRYTTEDDDREEWFAFLDTLVKARSRKPVNGLIVAVSLLDLAAGDEEAAGQLGQTLRERVDEVMARLKMIVPVYVMFTKCDLIAGFVEVFGALHKGDRGQIWGFTAPLSEKASGLGALFAQRFDELVTVLERKTLARLGEERQAAARERIYQFPLQFAALKSNLTELVSHLFAENVYQDTPVMRGVYFTSGTQEGRPFDRIMKSMAEAFGIRRVLPASNEPVTEAKSYFLRDVFAQVMFPDQNLAMRSSSESKRLQLRQYGAAAAGIAISLLLLLFPTIAFFKSRGLVTDTKEKVQTAVAAAKQDDARAAQLVQLLPLRDRVDELLQHAAQGAPASMRFGMYPSGEFSAAARGFYGGAIRQALVEPLLTQDALALDGFAKRVEGAGETPNDKEYAQHYDRLKLLLLVTSPKAEGEPALGEGEQAYVAKQLFERWRRREGVQGNAGAVQALEKHASVFARVLAQDAGLLLPRNEALVRRVRAALGRLPASQLALQQIVNDPALEEYELNLAAMIGGANPQLRGEAVVRGAFTRQGYEAVVSEQLASGAAENEAWVLARKAGPKEAQAQVALVELRSEYFRRYIQEWKAFLEGIRLPQPSASAEALAMLEDLTRGDPPAFGRLFRAVAKNVRLADDEPTEDGRDNSADLKTEVIDQLRKKIGGQATRMARAVATAVSGEGEGEAAGDEVVTAKDLEAAFAGLLQFGAPSPKRRGADKSPESLPIDVYQEQLVFLRDALRAEMESPDDKAPLLTRLSTAKVRVTSLIDSQEIGWRPRLTALLWPPVEGASRAGTNSVASGASSQWCSAVVSSFDRSLANRYPFNANGHDSAIADVADFFRPGQGTVWAFYGSTLQSDMLREGTEFRFAKRLGGMAENVYKPQLLTFLTRAQEISSALFAPGSGELGVQFSVHVQPSPKLASILLTVDGQALDYKNGPEEWHNFKWPQPGGAVGASIRVRTNKGVTETIQQEGEWGLFRLLEAASIQASPGARVFTAVWRLQSLDADVAIDFRPARTDTPFFGAPRGSQKLQLLRPFRAQGALPPRSIGKSSPDCAG